MPVPTLSPGRTPRNPVPASLTPGPALPCMQAFSDPSNNYKTKSQKVLEINPR